MGRVGDFFELIGSVVVGVTIVAFPIFFWVHAWRTHTWPNGDAAETAVYSTGICLWTVAEVVVLVLIARHQFRRLRQNREARRNSLGL